MAECKAIVPYTKPDLKERLEDEQEVLERYFYPKKYPILHKNNEPCFEHEVVLNGDRKYKLRVYVNEGYPDMLPDLVVCESPEPMPPWGGSHDTHTLQPKHGFLKICHWHWAAWKRENMIYQVFEKGEEWLEAYEKFLLNGKLPLDLEDMKLTEEEKLTVQFHQRLQCQVLVQSAIIKQVIFHQKCRALEICRTYPNFLKIMHPFHTRAIEKILLRWQLQISSASNDDIMAAQETLSESVQERLRGDPDIIMLSELFNLQCAVTLCKLENPGCTVNINAVIIQTPFGPVPNWIITPTGPRSLQDS